MVEKRARQLQDLVGTPHLLNLPLEILGAVTRSQGHAVASARINLVPPHPFVQSVRRVTDPGLHGLCGCPQRRVLCVMLQHPPDGAPTLRLTRREVNLRPDDGSLLHTIRLHQRIRLEFTFAPQRTADLSAPDRTGDDDLCSKRLVCRRDVDRAHGAPTCLRYPRRACRALQNTRQALRRASRSMQSLWREVAAKRPR